MRKLLVIFTIVIALFVTVLLSTLKLYGAINLSWVWVFAPLWLPATCVVAFFAVLTLIIVNELDEDGE